MPPKKRFSFQNRVIEKKVPNETRFRLEKEVLNLINDPATNKLEFSPSLSKDDRAFIHRIALSLGLKSRSTGRDSSRYITVYKIENPTKNTVKKVACTFLLVSSDTVINLKNRFPLAAHEEEIVITKPSQAPVPNTTASAYSGYIQQPRVPVFSTNHNLTSFRQNLPIFKKRNDILNAINSNSVVIICGETGCGKTTQVPQYILEDAQKNSRPVMIMCSMPRRIATTSVSERVAHERGEVVGNQIGYQIKLENRMSQRTVLTYCTNGVLLRHLLSTGLNVSNITHIIIDEIHERDRLSDFTLIALRQVVTKNPHLRLILMSATLDTDKFNDYFKNYLPYGKACPVISVPGRVFQVNDLFLEDILEGLEYFTSQMKVMKMESDQLSPSSERTSQDQEGDEISDQIKEDMAIHLKRASSLGEQQIFNDIVELTIKHKSLINYQEGETGMTGLMIAIAHEKLDIVEALLELQPSLDIHDNTGKTILDWRNICGDEDICLAVQAYVLSNAVRPDEDEPDEPSVSQSALYHAELYLKCHGNLDVDPDLIVAIIDNIHSSKKEGAILVFLAGYDVIMAVREVIYENDQKLNVHGRILVYVLHSRMQITDQAEVFKTAPNGSRKIILATNIAETSITINDVAFVIDAGKVNKQDYNSVSEVYSLRTQWISRACAQQRRGRAGRTCAGICFHLYSREQYEQMEPFDVPEILREPLEDLCLQAKKLILPTTHIEDFLGQCIEPPSPLSVKNAIQSLKTMEALDASENLTNLGYKMLEITAQPRLAKMLIYAVILKCLDPVLTIVCCLSEGDPFKIPANPAMKKIATQEKWKLSLKTVSDHMVFLRVFQEYQAAVQNRNEYRFCDSVFVNRASLDIVTRMRNQLKKQLNMTNSMEVNKYSDRWAVVKAAIMAGLYPNLARSDLKQKNIRTKNEMKVMAHTSSVLRERKDEEGKKVLPSQWIVFGEIHSVGILGHIRTCTVVSPITVCLFAGPSKLLPDAVQHGGVLESPVRENIIDLTGDDPDDAIDLTGDDPKEMTEDEDKWQCLPDKSQDSISFLNVDDWLKIPMHSESAELLYYLRLKWRSLVTRRLRNLHAQWSMEDEEVLRAVVEVLTQEDKALGFVQPEGMETIPRNDRVKRGQRFDRKNPPEHAKVRYFVIKQGDEKSLKESITRGVWAFTYSTAEKLTQCLKNSQRVVLVFLLHSSKCYQGFAEVKGLWCRNRNALPFAGRNLARLLPVEWLETRRLNCFKKLDSNGWDVHSALMAKRDGEEITKETWETVRDMWNALPFR